MKICVIYFLLIITLLSCAHSSSSEFSFDESERLEVEKLLLEFAAKKNNCDWVPDLTNAIIYQVSEKEMHYLRGIYGLTTDTDIVSLSFDSYCSQKGDVIVHLAFEKREQQISVSTLQILTVEFYEQ